MSEPARPTPKPPPSWAPPAEPPAAFGDVQRAVLKVVGGIVLVVAAGAALLVMDWRSDGPAETTESIEALLAGGGEAAAEGGAASLWVNADPLGATVYVDGDSVGVTPLWLDDVAVGARWVQILDGETVLTDTTVEVAAGQMAEVDLSMTAAPPIDAPTPVEVAQAPRDPTPPPAPRAPPPAAESRPVRTGALRVSSSPSGAVVALNGRRVGATPLSIGSLSTGRHTLTLSRQGYETVARRVDVRPGVEIEAVIDLRPREPAEPVAQAPPPDAPPRRGALEVLVRPWGTVYIDGVVRQRETDVVYRTELPVGTHRIRVTHPTLGTTERDVEVRDGSTARVEFDLNENAPGRRAP